MHIFADYLQLLTVWLYANPNWAFLITFLISFAESLAIIGSIIPGSVTMTAIGILAGSGVMDIGFTFVAAAAGAIGGDTASYALGFTFSDRLVDIWPFRRYPHWLRYGKDYFARHGGKSVLIGRFFGPLRSIIPVIAGMLRMNRLQFLLANIVSAIAWAILYVTPGVLIGAASNELSAESATRLFVFIIILLAMSWLASRGIKWLFLHVNHLLHSQLHKIWHQSKQHPRLSYVLKTLTPKYESNHYPTAALILLLSVCFVMTIVITLFVLQGSWIASINNPCYLFLQSIRTQPFDVFFIVVSLVISPLSLLTFSLAIALYALYYRDWRMLCYWISLIVTCSTLTWVLTMFIHTPGSENVFHTKQTPVFPAVNLTLATALFGFLFGFIHKYYRTTFILTARIVLATLLFLAGLSSLYLGDNWISSVVGAYFIGLTICLAHWIFYRRKQVYGRSHIRTLLPIILACILLLLTTVAAYVLHFKKLVHDHNRVPEQYVLTHDTWWNQDQTLLPVYTTNRVGHRIGLFNLQYLGALSKFEHALTNYGWTKQSDSLFYSLLMRVNGKHSLQELPVMTQLYLNKKPALTMTYRSEQGQTLYILRLWRSNYHLLHYHQAIWLGSVIYLRKSTHQEQLPTLFTRIVPALDGFKFNSITLPDNQVKSLPHTRHPKELMMIKESGAKINSP